MRRQKDSEVKKICESIEISFESCSQSLFFSSTSPQFSRANHAMARFAFLLQSM